MKDLKTKNSIKEVSETNQSRRDLLKKAGLTTMGIGGAIVTGLTMPTAQADNHLSKLDENSPQAKALGYKHDAAAVDVAKYPQSQGGEKNCASCQLYSAATAEGWGICPIFAGKLVNGDGWCSAWVPKAGA